MLSNVINAGKDIANRLTNKFLNLSEIEIKIKTATNDDNWGPNGSLMKEIADETFSTTNFQEVMTFLWYRIFTEKPPNNRRTYKGLVLLTYLIVNGSDVVAVSCKAHLSEIMKLQSYVDCHGMTDVTIRRKANDICELLNDSQRLSGERKRAKSYQTRNYRSDTVTGVGSFDARQSNAQPLGDIDDWEVGSRSLPHVIGESFMSFVTTFTQNISGPPPTETHDNFDIPATHYEIKTPVEDEYTYNSPSTLSQSRNHNRVVNVDKNDSNSKKESKETIKPIESVPEKLIIDFSEPEVSMAPNGKVIDTADLLFAIDRNKIANDIDEEFGNLRGWNDPDHLNPVTNNSDINNNTRTDFGNFFSPDFSQISSVKTNQSPSITSSIQLPTSQTHSHKASPLVTTQISNQKIGSTWSDIDALNIDLNNLCGRKRMYSKS